MFKFVALFALLAVVAARPGYLHGGIHHAPVAVALSPAVSHQSRLDIIHPVPIIHAAPIHVAPAIHAAPIAIAPAHLPLSLGHLGLHGLHGAHGLGHGYGHGFH